MSKNNNIENFISVLDTNRFGFKVVKTDFSDIEPEFALHEFKNHGVKLIISRINGKKIDLINKLEDLGLRVKDNQLTYKYDLNNTLPQEIEQIENYNIREVKEEDIPYLVKITEASFKGYGHYFADKKLEEKKCIELYKDWAYRSCKDKNVADKVFIAEFEGGAVGYLTFKILHKNNFKYAAGGLGSVSSLFRNKSLFQAITLYGLKWGKEIKLDWEEHNVLSSNYSVNRSFSKLGFRIVDSFVTLHGWIV